MAEAFRNITQLEWHGQFNTLARAERYGKRWLLKGLQPELAQNKTYIDLLRKEFDITMQARHPSVVGVVSIEYVEPMQSLCIVEEWIAGITLADWLKENPTAKKKQQVARQILDTVAHCHRQGVVHRDLKPSNVMVTRDTQQVKLIDFGLSDTQQYRSFKGAAGTVHYVAPEVLDGSTANPKSDIYSLGKILDDMKLPRRFRHIVEKAASLRPEERYASVEDLHQAFAHADMARRRQLAVTATALLMAGLCAAAFVTGYNLNADSENNANSKLTQQLLVARGDSTALANDTSLTAITIPEKDLHLFYLKPGVAYKPTTVSEDIAVDLGLSVLWAPYNLGADGQAHLMPGALVTHGFLEPFRTDLYPLRYPFGEGDQSYEGSEFDMARKLWGGQWRMPLESDFDELITKCRWEYVDIPGIIPGYIVTGPSGKQIFIPLSGFRYFDHFYSIGETGYYWTANNATESQNGGYAIVLNKDLIMRHLLFFGYNSFAIRPVLDR